MFRDRKRKRSSTRLRVEQLDFTTTRVKKDATTDAETFFRTADLLEVHAKDDHPFKSRLAQRKLHELGGREFE